MYLILIQILYYATEIYEQTGLGPTEVAYSTVGTGAVNVLVTIIAVSDDYSFIYPSKKLPTLLSSYGT